MLKYQKTHKTHNAVKIKILYIRVQIIVTNVPTLLLSFCILFGSVSINFVQVSHFRDLPLKKNTGAPIRPYFAQGPLQP
jgi:hypothetical protein